MLSIDDARDGIVGRGVLLDIPRLRGARWLEPGDPGTSPAVLRRPETVRQRPQTRPVAARRGRTAA